MTYKPTWDVSLLPPHVSKGLVLAAVAAGALGCCGVLPCVAGAVGCELAGQQCRGGRVPGSLPSAARRLT
jgi:hypothetical protein